jgi:hypothetical protein
MILVAVYIALTSGNAIRIGEMDELFYFAIKVTLSVMAGRHVILIHAVLAFIFREINLAPIFFL